jgi:hypothetical protein
MALIVTSTIWIFSVIFSIFDFQSSQGYSIFVLILLPISLLVYLGDFYGQQDEQRKEEATENAKEEVK